MELILGALLCLVPMFLLVLLFAGVVIMTEHNKKQSTIEEPTAAPVNITVNDLFRSEGITIKGKETIKTPDSIEFYNDYTLERYGDVYRIIHNDLGDLGVEVYNSRQVGIVLATIDNVGGSAISNKKKRTQVSNNILNVRFVK